MRFASILTAAFLATAACSDSTAPAIPLTDEEVGLLFSELSSVVGDVTGAGGPTAGAAPQSTITVSTSLDCLNGGSVSVTGTATETSTMATLEFTERFNTCRTETFTIGGSLRFTATIITPDETSTALHATMKGSLNVTHEDGRSGSCPIDVTLDVAANGQTFSVNANGTVCGRDANVAVDSVTG